MIQDHRMKDYLTVCGFNMIGTRSICVSLQNTNSFISLHLQRGGQNVANTTFLSIVDVNIMMIQIKHDRLPSLITTKSPFVHVDGGHGLLKREFLYILRNI
ncbi:hypothetical protein DERP_011275 [Dermatophagoides pteronyssinus]|uniref:Uncharacterized protein n=1 Tax=Dermatophagoides pteronyssinus TaxID=6956 RepID=A0ABQ8J793_DERPT|nr:hypothetical protein DERP_011275 [Dermatophagoides pteronyssinus]